MDSNTVSIIVVVVITLLFLITVLIDNIPKKIKRKNKSELIENSKYFVHPDVRSILNKKDSNTGTKKDEKEYVDNGMNIVDVFLNKINCVIADIK
jgi:hypothetical protein